MSMSPLDALGSTVPPDTLHVRVVDHVAVAEATTVLLKIAPAVARSAASLDLTTARQSVADLTTEERATLSLMRSGLKTGAFVGAVAGGVAGVAAGDPWLGPIGGAVGFCAGPVVAITSPRSPLIKRVLIWLAHFGRRFGG